MMQQNRNEQKWNDSPFRGTEMIVLSDELWLILIIVRLKGPSFLFLWKEYLGTVDKNLSDFLADIVWKGGEGVKPNLLKIANFQTKVCYFKLDSPRHSDYKTAKWIHKTAFLHVEFCLYINVFAREHVHWPKTHQPKTQKSACWKPVLNIRKQDSSHLQDFSSAFSTKDPVKWLSQSQRVFVAIYITIWTFLL